MGHNCSLCHYCKSCQRMTHVSVFFFFLSFTLDLYIYMISFMYLYNGLYHVGTLNIDQMFKWLGKMTYYTEPFLRQE
jgi:hypothetical protein